MRKIIYILFLAIFIISDSCVLFETCDSVRYQIISKVDIGGGICSYRAVAFTTCLVWNDKKYLEFTEKCSEINLSQIFDRDYINKKYGI